jgi:hypothetical protein
MQKDIHMSNHQVCLQFLCIGSQRIRHVTNPLGALVQHGSYGHVHVRGPKYHKLLVEKRIPDCILNPQHQTIYSLGITMQPLTPGERPYIC